MSGPELLTWFGGKVGVRWSCDSRLHLLKAESHTFCGIVAGLRPVTRHEANSCSWCESCLLQGQAQDTGERWDEVRS